MALYAECPVYLNVYLGRLSSAHQRNLQVIFEKFVNINFPSMHLIKKMWSNQYIFLLLINGFILDPDSPDS